MTTDDARNAAQNNAIDTSETETEPFQLCMRYDEECFREAYNERLRIRWPLLLVRVLLVLASLLAAYWFSSKQFVTIYFIAVALFLAVQPFFQRAWWLRNVVKDTAAKQPVYFEFNSDAIAVKSADSEGRFGWSALHGISISKQGYFLWPQRKIYYYLPKARIPQPGLHQLLQEKQRQSLQK